MSHEARRPVAALTVVPRAAKPVYGRGMEPLTIVSDFASWLDLVKLAVIAVLSGIVIAAIKS